jgi:hypothetical protein
MKFRKKPVVIEAFQFQQPTSVDDAPEWLIEAVTRGAYLVVDDVARISTLEGVMTAQPGDWIIRGVKGEIYPCKPDIFAATYEPASSRANWAGAGLDFGTALLALKDGKRVARAGWNGKGMFVYLVLANAYPAQTGAAKAHFGEGALVPYNAYLALKGADNTVSTWAPSGSDALAEDWLIVE